MLICFAIAQVPHHGRAITKMKIDIITVFFRARVRKLFEFECWVRDKASPFAMGEF